MGGGGKEAVFVTSGGGVGACFDLRSLSLVLRIILCIAIFELSYGVYRADV